MRSLQRRDFCNNSHIIFEGKLVEYYQYCEKGQSNLGYQRETEKALSSSLTFFLNTHLHCMTVRNFSIL